jgi:uncharacterized hydantoinase/oxoprolinase family protein
VIGIELENAKVKIFALDNYQARTYPFAYTPIADRSHEIEAGFKQAIAQFERESGLALDQHPVVIASSAQFAYPSFRQAQVHLIHIAETYIPHARLAGLKAFYSLKEALIVDPLELAAARVVGIKFAACALAPEAVLAIDVGTTSTELVPLKGPLSDNLSRLREGLLLWLGAVHTPLDYVAPEVCGYPVVPRIGRMAAVLGLLGLSNEDLWSQRGELELEIAQSVGLDREILGPKIRDLALDFHRVALTRLGSAIQRIRIRFGIPPGPVAVMGIGKQALAIPALHRLGLFSIIDVEEEAGIPSNFGAAYGLALAAKRELLPML